ncbi:IS630 family transposase [Tunicatimonas pelagia]|uniref:IS630 family transposase n=1 Tax=Tunicatimonas pelagia TaxID=931531 RepID=UPI0026670674|nr:IS630 family transposase [Tunicatimonas pelagia]WKN43918.1 IS630 family transposase [Tunicatimonas pelagia]
MTKTWCIGVINAEFLARMENILRLYALPYDERYPVVCLDERPRFLIGDVVEGLSLKPGQVKRAHYEYQKNGSCCLFAAIEPLTGKRIAQVFDRRRKVEYAEFMQTVALQFPKAEKVRVIQDNLNTHNTSSFYERFDAQTAYALSQKFDFHYTPKKASWLNTIETEFSALSRLCLQRRIPTKEMLEQAVLQLVQERNDKHIKIGWKFSITDARSKLKRHYTNVNPVNKIL